MEYKELNETPEREEFNNSKGKGFTELKDSGWIQLIDSLRDNDMVLLSQQKFEVLEDLFNLDKSDAIDRDSCSCFETQSKGNSWPYLIEKEEEMKHSFH